MPPLSSVCVPAPFTALVAFALAALPALGCAANLEAPADEEPAAAEEDLTSATCRKTASAAGCQVSGVIVSTAVVEIDPHAIGEACIVFVKDASGKRLGLLEDRAVCTFTTKFALKTGLAVRWSKGELKYVASAAKRDLLKRFDGAAIYYELVGDLREASPSTSLDAVIERAIDPRRGSDRALADRVTKQGLPAGVAPALVKAETEIAKRKIPGTGYKATLEGFYAVHASATDRMIVAYVAWGNGFSGAAENPDYSDAIVIGFDLTGQRIYDRIESF